MKHIFKKHKLFYGYWIVAVTFLCRAISEGILFYTFPLFFSPLQAEFNWGRGAISLAFTIYVLILGLMSPFIGRMVDRYGAKRVIFIGAVVTGLGFLWLTSVQHLWTFYAAYVVLGLGTTAVGPVPTTQLVSNWFTKRRGLAIGIMSSGVSIGGLILAPIVGSYLIPSFGWRASYLIFALLTWGLIIPAPLLVIKARPSDLGLYPDGIETPEVVDEAKPATQASEGWTLGMALKTSAFWLIAFAFLTSGFSHIGSMQHQANYLTDIGFPVAAAVASLSALGFSTAIGKFAFGWLCDRIQAKYIAAISVALQLAAIIVLLMLKATSPLSMIWLYAISMGLGLGGWMVTKPLLISINFGLASYGVILGMSSLITGPITSLGPIVAGYMFDSMQTYFWALILFLMLYTVAIPCMLAIRRPKLRLEKKQNR